MDERGRLRKLGPGGTVRWTKTGGLMSRRCTGPVGPAMTLRGRVGDSDDSGGPGGAQAVFAWMVLYRRRNELDQELRSTGGRAAALVRLLSRLRTGRGQWGLSREGPAAEAFQPG